MSQAVEAGVPQSPPKNDVFAEELLQGAASAMRP